MPRIARVIVPNIPHHVTQRGNRRQPTFFYEDDYAQYLQLMAQYLGEREVEVWAYCLMPNHVHLILTPASEDGLRRGIGEAHRRYTRMVNFREGWRGHLWQGRFASFPMDERRLLAAARYVELNPVRAGLVRRAQDYAWSSAAAHLAGRDDALVRVRPMLELVPDWRSFLRTDASKEETDLLRRHERTGRPLGSRAFVAKVSKKLNRNLWPKQAGRKRNESRRK
jgi:putative transposase